MKLEGQQITLRHPKPADSEDIFKYAKDREVSQYMTRQFPYPYKRSDAEGFIKRVTKTWKQKEKDNYIFVTEHKKAGEVIGTIGLKKVDMHNKNAELGYWIGKKYWRQGIASEAIGLIVKYGFEELGLERIEAGVFHPNLASQKLLEKAGFTYEGRWRRAARRGDQWFDRLWYAILKEDIK